MATHGNLRLQVSEVTAGLRIINSHRKPIVDAVFSPDGLNVTTASLDGFVKFFSIEDEDDTK